MDRAAYYNEGSVCEIVELLCEQTLNVEVSAANSAASNGKQK